MIFVTIGSQKFQFNRLLEELDRLIDTKKIEDDVFAQIGVSDYKPKNYKYVDFTTQEEFAKKIDEADLIITHGGTGVIVNSLKKNKKIIAIPRLSKYGEHVDDHQIQLIKEFEEMNFIEPVYEIENLAEAIEVVRKKEYNKYISNTEQIIKDITEFIGE